MDPNADALLAQAAAEQIQKLEGNLEAAKALDLKP